MTRQGDGQFFILRKTLLCRRCGVVVCLFQKPVVLPLTSSLFSEDTFLRSIFMLYVVTYHFWYCHDVCGFFPLQTVQDHLFHVCTLLWCDVTPLLSFPHHVWRCFFLVVYFLLYIGCRTYIFFILTTSYGFDSFLKHWIRSTRHCNNQCHVLEDFFILYVVQ